eukprot:8325397-Alexandrium_andersonii.AAC.1
MAGRSLNACAMEGPKQSRIRAEAAGVRGAGLPPPPSKLVLLFAAHTLLPQRRQPATVGAWAAEQPVASFPRPSCFIVRCRTLVRTCPSHPHHESAFHHHRQQHNHPRLSH